VTLALREEPAGQRPAPLRGSDRRRALAREAPAAIGRAWRREPALGPQRRPRVVRDLAGPDEIPQGGQRRVRLDLGREDEVEPELGAPAERLADPVVALTLRARGPGGRAERGGVLAEVERDPVETRAHPDDLAGGAERVEPGGLVAGHAARQHVGLPERDRKRQRLQ